MNRVTKQISYGAFYACVLAAIIYGGVGVATRKVPTCVDNTKNQDETEVDCGGANCVSCVIKHLAPVAVLPVKILDGTDAKHATALIELRNPNINYGTPLFSYRLNIFTTSTSQAAYAEQVTLPMYPAEVKYRVTVNIPFAPGAVTRAEAVSNGEVFDWRPNEEFAKPKLPMREIKTVVNGNRIMITGNVKNDNPFFLRHVTVNVFFDNKDGSIASVSKTVINDMYSSEERGFQVVAPLPAAFIGQPLPAPRVIVDAERQL